MTDRIPLDNLTSDALDALYEQLDAAEAGEAQRQLATAREALASATTRAARAEAALARVRAVAGWAIQGWSDLSPQKVLLAVEGEPPAPAPAATQATELETTARVFAGLHRSTADTVTRVIDLYEQWVKAGPPPLGASLARWWDARLAELHNAIQPADQTTEK
ncbi:hypothetical protein AB0O68_15530 [Streptomyces sp. NPDC087512]|uniref:hypothetical protein n=1 Tax=Streptomyces sp. NPDC087512 TaxID=3155059 RepID=UPI003422FCD5